ncbi:EamA family transporter [Pseudodesulfovibrio sp. JC047]|uniref:EamA family transporter n=1 Tax=Pseudodesulfovibrio sp. JC047 TaxID=2683199 RepID=UPI0013D30598|nr:EamA family transporter [Pseudodesulfovibrio sp. JC047]
MTNSKKAIFFGLVTVGIWSTVASAFKIALTELDPFQLLLIACTTSIVALAGIMAFQGTLHQLFAMPRREMLRSALLGILNPFLYYIILFKAYDLLPAQEAQPINYTWAITLSLLSIPLLGQKMSSKDLGAICLSYFGIVVISTHGNPFSLEFSNLTGVGLALASTVIWAVYWIFNTRSTAEPLAGLLLGFLCAFPLILVTTLCVSELPTVSTKAALAALYVGIFEMGITFALWLTAMKYAATPDGGGTARIANLIFLSPFLSLIFIHFLVGEEILPATVAGLGFIVAGNCLMQYKKSATK